jgi:hypothetical protein
MGPQTGKNITEAQSGSAETRMDGSPTRARTWDLRINSPSILYVISLHHQLLTASAHLRHRSRMQCNAGVRKTALLRFCIQLVPDPCRSDRHCKSSAIRAGAQHLTPWFVASYSAPRLLNLRFFLRSRPLQTA